MDVESGKLGLPELQRGYVGKPVKVRKIGVDNKAYASTKSLVIDGQQHLISFYAVRHSKEIINENFN